MEMLAKLLQEKVGLSEEMSQQAATVAFEFLKEKLPDSIADKLEAFTDGQGDLALDPARHGSDGFYAARLRKGA